ncbi:MAG TPA: hypothetical protein VMT17_11160 [Anaeromyxobacteraceae bacterium]|nr:hypothetical protein [Anaeromyxobacteraceae bacterium]
MTVAPPATAAAAGVVLHAEMAMGVTAFAVAVPVFFTASVAVKAWPVFTVVGLGVNVAESAAGVCTVTDAVTVPVVTVVPLTASVPLADVLRLSVPELDDEQPVYWKFTVAPPATLVAAGVPVQEAIAMGVTAFAADVPPFVTARVAVKLWPVSTVVGLGVSVAVSEDALFTTTCAVAAADVTVAPLFASVPLAVALSVRVCCVDEEHPVYWKFTVAPPATAAAAGVPVQADIAEGVTAFADAVPLFLTASVAVNTWPVLAVVVLGERTPDSAAGACTVTDAVTVAVETVVPLTASVPLADVLRVSVPAVAVEQPVYWKFTVAPPATAAAAGVPVQEAMAIGVTAFTAEVPPFFTARVAVNACPVSTVVWLGVSVAVSVAPDWTVTDDVTVPVETAAPLFASVPLADELRVSVPVAALEQPAYWKFTVAPPATAAAAGVPVQEAIAIGVTAFAAAVPPFFTASVAVKTWPVFTVVALGVSVAVRLAACWTVTLAVAAAEVTVAPVFASVPLAVALSASVPADALEQPVYWKFTVAPPATAAAAGVPVQADIAAGATAFAVAVPLFLIASVAVNVWPVLAVVVLGERTPDSAAGVCTVTDAVTVPVETVLPLFASVPLAEVLSDSVPDVDEEHPVYWKFTVAPAATAAAAGVPVQEGMATGVTAFTATDPLFFTARVAVKV